MVCFTFQRSARPGARRLDSFLTRFDRTALEQEKAPGRSTASARRRGARAARSETRSARLRWRTRRTTARLTSTSCCRRLRYAKAEGHSLVLARLSRVPRSGLFGAKILFPPARPIRALNPPAPRRTRADVSSPSRVSPRLRRASPRAGSTDGASPAGRGEALGRTGPETRSFGRGFILRRVESPRARRARAERLSVAATRLAFCASPATARWLVQQEAALFAARLRLGEREVPGPSPSEEDDEGAGDVRRRRRLGAPLSGSAACLTRHTQVGRVRARDRAGRAARARRGLARRARARPRRARARGAGRRPPPGDGGGARGDGATAESAPRRRRGVRARSARPPPRTRSRSS